MYQQADLDLHIPQNKSVVANDMIRFKICLLHKFGVRVPQDWLRYPYPEDWFLNRVISDISVVLREATLTISDSTGEPVSMEFEIVRGFS